MQVSEEFAKMVRRALVCFVVIVAISFIFLASPSFHVAAQNAGTVGIQATNTSVFLSQATSTNVLSSVLPDGGYAANYLIFQGLNFTGTIDFEGTPPGAANSVALAQASINDNGPHLLQLGGYYQNLRVRLTNTSTGGTVSAWYSGSSSPIAYTSPALGSNGPAAPIACDHTAMQTISNGSQGSPFAPINNGDRVIICGFSLSFNGATSAGNVQLGWAGGGCPAGVTTWEMYTTASTPQFVQVLNQQRSSAPTTATWPCVSNNSGAGLIIALTYASVSGL